MITHSISIMHVNIAKQAWVPLPWGFLKSLAQVILIGLGIKLIKGMSIGPIEVNHADDTSLTKLLQSLLLEGRV